MMSDFKLEIESCQVSYNHLHYIVAVDSAHGVGWRVQKPGQERGFLATEYKSIPGVEASPTGAIIWAHESARAWIDNYVETHLALQGAVEVARSKYGGVARSKYGGVAE